MLIEYRCDGDSSYCGPGSELAEQLVTQREISSGQGDESSYQVPFRDPAAEQPADVQGELVEVSGGVGLEQHGELAGWGCFGGCVRRWPVWGGAGGR
jgi:hypothetical protein